MTTFSISDDKRKLETDNFVQYLALPYESKDVIRASKGTLTFRNGYRVRHQMTRTLRRLRRTR